MNESATAGMALKDWIDGLSQLPESGFSEACTRYVREHPVDADSLKPYCFFDEHHYTRNLVFKNDVFEVLVLCWEGGQESATHNHRDQDCWMVMGFGCLENINYEVYDRDAAAQPCQLRPTSPLRITREAPLAVDPEEPVHKVINCKHVNERAASIHIYSKPFDTCEVYLADGTYRDVQLSYYSEFGERCTDPGYGT